MNQPALTPGRILYLFYHLPLAEAKRTLRTGGLSERWRDWRGTRAMAQAAEKLPALSFPGAEPLIVHQLTGRAFLAQSLFCLWSLARASRCTVAPYLYDDGTLGNREIDRLRATFPRLTIIPRTEITAQLDHFLPATRFPVLRERFAHYPQMAKLLAPHVGARGWKLVLDADLLFFRRPEFLLHWLHAPDRPLHLIDVANAYGYPPASLSELAGRALPFRLNVGACGLRSETIDWTWLEHACATLLARHGTHYLLEQALTALLMAGQPCAIPSALDYVILPNEREILEPRAVMHHFVATSKRGYVREAWRRIVQ